MVDGEMPEFVKPDQILPVTLPSAPISGESPSVLPVRRSCAAKNKEGNPCRVPPLKEEVYCLGHAKSMLPEKAQKWAPIRGRGFNKQGSFGTRAVRKAVGFKSRSDLLALLSRRLDLVQERFGDLTNPDVEEMICNLCRTYAAVAKIEASEDVKSGGWRMKGAV